MMDIVLLLLGATLLQYPGDVTVTGQFTAAPPTCPGDTFTFRCTVEDMSGITIWRVNGSSECSLVHSTANVPVSCGVASPFTAAPGTEFGTSSTSFTSTLSGTATTTLDGTLVECFGPAFSRDAGNMVGNSTLQIVGPPSVPILSCVDLSGDISGAVNVTVSWRLSGGDSADFYLINITTNAPQLPYGGLLNITASVTQHELTGFMAGYEYNITVCGVNCGNQEGSESEPLSITLEVPAVSTSCNITLLYKSTGKLVCINCTWDSVSNSVDPCSDVTRNITQYQISFQTGSVVDTEIVDIARCTAGRCSLTFEPPSNPPSSYDNVSVAAETMVGVGAARTCTTQAINMTNNLLAEEVIEITSCNGATLNCAFLSGFSGSAQCAVQYGTDPTYINLPYSEVSTETGTAGDTVSVVLRERLNSSTVYYYTVSAVSGNVAVTVQGNFTILQYSTCDTSWLQSQIGLIVSGTVASIITFIFAAAAVVWVYVHHKKTTPVLHTEPDGRDEEVDMQGLEEERYCTLQHDNTSPDSLDQTHSEVIPSGVMYADLAPHTSSAAVSPPNIDGNVQYTLLVHDQKIAMQRPLEPEGAN